MSPEAIETTKFMNLAPGERVEKEYFVRKSDRRIFSGKMILMMIISAFVGAMILGLEMSDRTVMAERYKDDYEEALFHTREAMEWDMKYAYDDNERAQIREFYDREFERIEERRRELEPQPVEGAMFLWFVIPPFLVFLYFVFRHRHNSKGYLVLTDRRVLYYEYDEHIRQNYRYLEEVHLNEITSVHLGTGRKFLTKYMFIMVTSKRFVPIYVSGVGGVSAVADLLRPTAGSLGRCIPADDAVECIQELGSRIRGLQVTSTTTSIAPSAEFPESSAIVCPACEMSITLSGPKPKDMNCPYCGTGL